MNRCTAGDGAIACRNCRHYFITWDRAFPHGCRAHNFKSRSSPATEVYEASGLRCLFFVLKKARPAAESPQSCF